MIIEQWATTEDYEKYFSWRTETGEVAELTELLAKPIEFIWLGKTSA